MKCLNCNKEIDKRKKYCNHTCQMEYQYKQYIERWLLGLETGIRGKSQMSLHVRRYLFEINESSCQICGWNKINPTTNKTPLEIHHIDGDYKNNAFENLQLLCPNCHSLTSTYKALNYGSGRQDNR